MGCGGSKVAADGQELAPRPRTQEAKGPPTNRPPSSRRQGSQRAPRTSASRGGSRRESRGGRSRRESRGGSSRSNRDSRHITDRPKTGAGLPTVEEQPASDSEIEHDINTLSTLIGHHAQNFYQSRGITLVNREIGMAMINRLITTTTSGRSVADDLSRSLEPYIDDPSNEDRHENLVDLCRMAARIRRMTRGHPSDWTFGPLEDEDMHFPRVMNNGVVVINARYD